MKSLSVEQLEKKLENGVQVYSAKEVAYLLNQLRIYRYLNSRKTIKPQ